ncbi:ATP-binding protein [Telmatospirillum sp.]|uniref:ATP-binding protein n=1 Tax=Telmatospirillum sp. TaxID=2079197 RepID=UPI0028465862|nr:ATP-binding protein [Telmatospirillum sp.]MDR3437481.1 ATP-binding protein [Telmatospirillum sp.]
MSHPHILPTVVCSRQGMARFCGVDVPDHLQALVVERTTCPNGNPDCACNPVVSIVGGIDEAGIGQALTDFGGCVEVADGKLLAGPHLQEALASNALYMALSTATAYSLAPAHLFCDVLAKRLALGDKLRDGIELAVHEAIINGLLHGNLEISSDDRQTLAGFEKFCAEVAAKLTVPSLADRCIEVFAVADLATVTLSVVDSGPGYTSALVSAPDEPEKKSGRGLKLISHFADHVEIGDGGRKLSMRFVR